MRHRGCVREQLRGDSGGYQSAKKLAVAHKKHLFAFRSE